MRSFRLPRWIVPAVLVAGVALVAPPGQSALAKGKALKIEPLFQKNCMRCHNINGVNSVCPDLSTIGKRHDAAYIRQSILEPNAYIVPGFPKDVMPLNFKEQLTPQQVDKIVAFLLTLKGQTIDKARAKQGVKW